MIEQMQVYPNNIIVIEIIDSFSQNDEKFIQKLFEEKKNQGFKTINLLVKLDEMKISSSSTKAFFEDAIYGFRNYQYVGHIAIVAHSKIIKALVPIDNLFFERASKGRLERYFDISQMEEAKQFVGIK